MGLFWTILGLLSVPLVMTIDDVGGTRIRIVKRMGTGYWIKTGGTQCLLDNGGRLMHGNYKRNWKWNGGCWKWVCNPIRGLSDMDDNETIEMHSDDVSSLSLFDTIIDECIEGIKRK